VHLPHHTIENGVNSNDDNGNVEARPSIKAAVFFVHGGIFAFGDRDSHSTISRGLANLGVAVVTASFRMGSEAPYKTGITMRDLKDVTKYVKGRWEGIPFGLVGSSSGGFLGLSLAQELGPNEISFVISICPVANPYIRATYLRSCIDGTIEGTTGAYHAPEKASWILTKQLSFWEDDETMLAASESFQIKAARQRDVIPTLLIVGSIDKNVPFSVIEHVQQWATRTVVVGGYGHEISMELVKGGGYHCYLGDVERFLNQCVKV